MTLSILEQNRLAHIIRAERRTYDEPDVDTALDRIVNRIIDIDLIPPRRWKDFLEESGTMTRIMPTKDDE